MGLIDLIRNNCDTNGSAIIKQYMGKQPPSGPPYPDSDPQYVATNFLPNIASAVESYIASLATLGTDKATGNLKIGDMLVQWGWSSIQGANSRGLSATLTYPTAYTVAPLVFAVNLGTKLGAPTAIGDFNVVTAGNYVINCRSRSITTTNCVVEMTVDVDYGIVADTYWEGYGWLTIGKWN